MSIKVQKCDLKFVTLPNNKDNKQYLCVCKADIQEVFVLSLNKVFSYSEVKFEGIVSVRDVSKISGVKDKFSYDYNYFGGLYPYSDVELSMSDVRKIERVHNKDLKKDAKR